MTLLGDHHHVTTVVRSWFGRGTSHLARECDRAGCGPTGARGAAALRIGLTPEVGGLRPVRTTHSRAMVTGPGLPGMVVFSLVKKPE
jgi:hypothetical protein